MKKSKNSIVYTVMTLMIVFSLSQLVPSLQLAGLSVWIGLIGFFVIQKVNGIKLVDSAVSFKKMRETLKRKEICLWIAVLLIVQLATVIVGKGIFGQAYIEFDVGRAMEAVNAQNLLIFAVIILFSSIAEEIAWRGLFLDHKPGRIPCMIWVLFSSVLFAIGHFSSGNMMMNLFGMCSNFLCSLIFSTIFYKSRNCMTSGLAHAIGNYAEFILLLFFLC